MSASAGSRRERVTTPPAIALNNFQGQVRSAESRFTRQPGDVALREAFADFLFARGQMLGAPVDLSRAAKLGAEAKIEDGANPRAKTRVHLLHASSAAAVHRFSEALAALERIESPPDQTPEPVVRLRGAIFAATGRLGEALPLILAVRRAKPEIGIITLEGKVLGAMGKLKEAEEAFAAGEAAYVNPAPFAIVDLQFERGLLAERNGDLSAAKASYRAALERLPQHAHAALHLATLVPPKEGIALLEGLLRTSTDPEVRGRLGALRELEAKGSGEADVKEATAGYEAALTDLPEAYADHAAWFFLGPGHDAARAWSWAEKNLAIRSDAGAFELAIAAAAASKQPREVLCELVGRAKAYEWPTPMLKDAIAGARCD